MNDHISTLNNLIQTCKDGEQGFRTAAEGLKDPQIKSRFQQFASERGAMVRELQDEVRKLGGDPQQTGSVSGSLHRGWMDIKSAVTGKDDHAILAEAERGEDVAKDQYEKALKAGLTGSAATIVQAQASKVRQAHDQVRDLRDREKVAK